MALAASCGRLPIGASVPAHQDDFGCRDALIASAVGPEKAPDLVNAHHDLFRRICSEYRVDEMKSVLTSELRHMTEFVYNFYQLRTTEAVNRLALLSLIFGGGAVLTGFFGMNFGREFTRVVFEGQGSSWLHYLLVFIVTTFVLGSLLLRTIVVLRSWREYFAILNPPQKPRPCH